MTIGLHTVTIQLGTDAPVDISCLVDQVAISHGRDDTDSQPSASACTLDISLDTGDMAIPSAVEVGSLLRVTTQIGTTTVVRFVGSVTDISQGWDDAGPETPDKAVMQLIATSHMADLGRRIVGDTPWPQQLDGARVAAILSAAGITLSPVTSDPGTVQILPTDVDAQPALDLAQAVASDAGGLLWETAAAEIRYADAEHRRNQTPALVLDACDILVTPTWRRTTEGLINAVSIGYGVAPDGGEAPRFVAQRDDSIAKWGEFGLSSTTQLAQQADAAAMGNLLLTQNSAPVWVMAALPVDIKGLSDADTLTLLGLDIHGLISLTGLPAAGGVPSQTALWVEGWRETLAWADHQLELVISGYCRTVPPPRWNDVKPETTWDSAPGTWDGASCMPPVNLGRWDDQPASLRWDQVAPATTWDNYVPSQ